MAKACLCALLSIDYKNVGDVEGTTQWHKTGETSGQQSTLLVDWIAMDSETLRHFLNCESRRAAIPFQCNEFNLGGIKKPCMRESGTALALPQCIAAICEA